MANKKQQPEQLTFSKKIVCVYCGYEPRPEDLGKACIQCNGRYEVVDKENVRRPFAKDLRQNGPI